ncbi:MAG: excalibur calcium-binding domain-containing protein [Pseudomonadota bacterium]
MRKNRLEDYLTQSRAQSVWDVPSDHEMPLGERLMWKIGVLGPILAVPFVLFAWSPFPPVLTAMHYAAAVGCSVGDYMGVAPAAEGNPGYHRHLDPDRDGVACEPAPQRTLSGDGPARFMRPGGA